MGSPLLRLLRLIEVRAVSSTGTSSTPVHVIGPLFGSRALSSARRCEGSDFLLALVIVPCAALAALVAPAARGLSFLLPPSASPHRGPEERRARRKGAARDHGREY